jgi:hypothetical protein
MSNIRDMVQVMPLGDIRQLILDWEQLERDGKIGDCLLRETARNFIGAMSFIHLPSVMRDFAFEAYRFIAKVYGASVFKEDFMVEIDQ